MPELYIPPLWEKDPSEAFDEAKGMEKPLLKFQVEAANLLKNINDRQATPQRLAWMILWTRVFTTLDGARAALIRNSGFTLELLNRVIEEAELIAQTIIDPYTQKRLSRDDARTEMLERLSAYTAWCLWQDWHLYENMMERNSLDQVWDDSNRYEIARDPQQLEAFEALFGPLEIEAPEELQKKRLQQEENAFEAQQRIDSYLKQPELDQWLRVLTDRRVRSFFDMLDKSEGNVYERLRALNRDYAYNIYKSRSMIIHGSTFDQSLRWIEDKVYPKFFSTEAETETLVEQIGATCRVIIVMLAAMQSDLWNRD